MEASCVPMGGQDRQIMSQFDAGTILLHQWNMRNPIYIDMGIATRYTAGHWSDLCWLLACLCGLDIGREEPRSVQCALNDVDVYFEGVSECHRN